MSPRFGVRFPDDAPGEEVSPFGEPFLFGEVPTSRMIGQYNPKQPNFRFTADRALIVT